jgi:hypothetical protein
MADTRKNHEYSYTLARALARMRDDLAALAVTLEKVHQASEGEDGEALHGVTQRYPEASDLLD